MPYAYVWRCEQGHEVAISELAFWQMVVMPRCPRMIDGHVCMGRLVRRLRVFGE